VYYNCYMSTVNIEYGYVKCMIQEGS
jgi:hypothetical protein